MSSREDDDSDAPEEVSAQQGIQQDEEIRKAQELSKARARREGKERRKRWADRLTPRPKKAKPSEDNDEMIEDEEEEEVDTSNQSQANTGMLPNDIVNLLAAREKQVFLSDSEDEKTEKKSKPKKKKTTKSGAETVILKELPPAHCVQNSLEFLNRRKSQVPRSAAVLTNSNQALRLLSSTGLLK